MLEELKERIIADVKEYNETSSISLDYSININHKDEIIEFLQTIDVKTGHWIIYKCDVCETYHNKNYVHLELINYEMHDDRDIIWTSENTL